MHRDRRYRTDLLATLAEAGEWEDYYRRLTLWEFPREARMGWQLAFLRPFAVPRMAEILVEAGHLVHNPLKRAYDTGLIIYELVHDGIDGPRGRQMIRIMNQAHHGRAIDPQDMTYVLCAFIIAPMRYIEQTGWRPVSEHDRRASLEFYTRMGQMMNIKDIPASYAEAEQLYDDYEARMVAPSPSGAILGKNLISVLKERLPAPARPLAELVFTSLLSDPRIARALHLKPPTAPVALVARLGKSAYGRIQAVLPPRTTPIFVPGQEAGSQYPQGYTIDQLGPDSCPQGHTFGDTECHDVGRVADTDPASPTSTTEGADTR